VTKGLIFAVLLPLACSNGARSARDASDAGDDARIVPEGLEVSALAGGNGALELSALTLRRGPHGIEIYAALKNEGEAHACSAAFSTELYDRGGRSLAAGIGGLLTQRLYRLTDGSSMIAACVGPGDVAMAAVTDLAPDLSIEDVAHVVYRCPYFALDVVAIDGLTISGLQSVAVGAGEAYAGTLENRLDVALRHPSVTVFSTNRVGRPLGFANASSATELSPGDSWHFETNAVATRGAHYVAYPAGAIADREP
jgi:hypothetical protein